MKLFGTGRLLVSRPWSYRQTLGGSWVFGADEVT